MDDIAKIADGLSGVQKLDFERLPLPSNRCISVTLLCSDMVKRRRLFWILGPHWLFLTRKGIAVRDHLRSKNDA